MHFCPERLIQVRESLHINKAEAARRLNLSAMAYGRYERGEREHSYQYAFYIAYTETMNQNRLSQPDFLSSWLFSVPALLPYRIQQVL